MVESNFSLKHSDLFEKIIKIVREHDGNYYAVRDDSKTTPLIMKEIEKWYKLISKTTPLSASIIFDRVKSKNIRKKWDWVREERCKVEVSKFLNDFAERMDKEITKEANKK